MASTIQVDKIQDTGGNTILSSNSTGTFTYEAASGANFTALDADNVSAGTLAVARGGTGTTSYSPGITVADEWRITATFTGDAEPITSNLEQSDTECQGQMGSAMSHSSGIWTFPSTGFYLVMFQIIFYDADDRYMYAYISATDDNSTYNTVTDASAFLQDTSGAAQMKTSCYTILDIADTSLCKVKFNVYSNGGTVVGDSRFTSTGFNFLRLGDT